MAPAQFPKPNQPADTPVTILSVSGAGDDHTALRQVLAELPCRIAAAGTCKTAFRVLRRARVSIVICERDLPDGTWRDVLNQLGASAGRPLLIVTSRAADNSLWAEVLNLGGFDVIAKPFNPREVRHVLETARLRSGVTGATQSAAA